MNGSSNPKGKVWRNMTAAHSSSMLKCNSDEAELLVEKRQHNTHQSYGQSSKHSNMTLATIETRRVSDLLQAANKVKRANDDKLARLR